MRWLEFAKTQFFLISAALRREDFIFDKIECGYAFADWTD